MAFGNIGNAGTAVGSTSTSSFTLTTTGNSFNASSGRFGILRVAIDNISTSDGPSNDVTSVTGGNGTWTKLGEYTNANGGAGNGVTVALWLFMPNANNAVGTVITINLSGAVVDKSARFWLHTHTIGDSVRDADTPVYNSVDASNDFGSCAISGLTSKEYLFVSALGKEANTTTNITASSGFTAVGTLRSRNNAAAIISNGEYDILTGTGATSNPTLAVSGDAVNVFVALEEFVPGGGDGNATGASLSVTSSLAEGAATGTAQAAGADQSVSLSLVGGAASGATVLDGNATGAALTVAGSIAGGTGTGSASATGLALSEALSLSSGDATGDGAASGASLTLNASLSAGSASSEVSGNASGAALGIMASVSGGAATGAASATGAALTATASLSAGAASGTANAGGMSRNLTLSISAGAASSAFDGNATGASLTITCSLSGGKARGPIDPAAFDRTGRMWNPFLQSFAA